MQHFFFFLSALLSTLGRNAKFLLELLKSSSSLISSPFTYSMPLVFVLVGLLLLFFILLDTISKGNNQWLRPKKLFNLRSVKFVNIFYTFYPDLALALKCRSDRFLAYCSASSNLIYLLCSRSHLLPTIMIGSSMPNYCRNSLTHIDIF